MGVVEDFYKSGDLGLDVSAGISPEAVEALFNELANFPDVILAVSGTTVILYNKRYVKVVVKDNGS